MIQEVWLWEYEEADYNEMSYSLAMLYFVESVEDNVVHGKRLILHSTLPKEYFDVGVVRDEPGEEDNGRLEYTTLQSYPDWEKFGIGRCRSTKIALW